MDVLRQFGIPAVLKLTTGNIVVNFADLTISQSDQFSCWLHYLLLAEPAHRNAGYSADNGPDTHPRVPLPEALAPGGRSDFVGNASYDMGYV